MARGGNTHKFSQTRQRREQGWRSFTLLVNPIEDENELRPSLKYAVKRYSQGAEVLASRVVTPVQSFREIGIDRFQTCRDRALEQMPPGYALAALDNSMCDPTGG